MRTKRRTGVFGAILVAFAIVATSCGSGGGATTIKVGSTNFTEQEILGEIYAQALEANGFTVERRFNLGARDIVEPALESGEIDLYAEYAGTVLEYLNNGAGEASGDAAATVDTLRQRFADRGVTVLDYAPAVDANALVVTQETAAKYGLTKISDLASIAGDLVFGGPPECPKRPFCLIGFQDTYGLNFKEFKPLDTGGPITVAALENGEIDVGLLFSSDGAIAAKNFVVLQDDRHLQPADNIVPVVRTAVNSQELDDVVNAVSAKITTSELSQMNKLVNIDKEDASTVAHDWLAANGFISG
ncbi:MAG: ABC transporter substrate-binding protein [Acidimicrobiia bacterium]